MAGRSARSVGSSSSRASCETHSSTRPHDSYWRVSTLGTVRGGARTGFAVLFASEDVGSGRVPAALELGCATRSDTPR